MGAEKSKHLLMQLNPLEAMYTAMESTREALTNGVQIVTGEGESADTMGAEDPRSRSQWNPQ